MALGRKRKSRLSSRIRRTVQLRRYIRRNMRRGMVGKIQNQVHHFVRSTLIEDLVIIPASGYNAAYQFTLDQLPNFNEFVALYDSYKIKSVVLRVEPAFDSNNMANPQILSQKYLRVVHDYDDSTPLTGETQYYEYGNMKSYSCTKPFKVVLYPKVAAEIYRTALSTSYEQRTSPWLDLSGSGASIPHYGIKIFFPYLGIAESFQFRIIAKFHVEMRQSR